MSTMAHTKPGTACVTGAARGIGLAIVEKLAATGHRVLMLDIANEALAAAATTLTSGGYDVLPVLIDLSNSAAVQRLPESIGDEVGNVSVLVNNAGISPKLEGRRTSLVDTPLEHWDMVMRVNLTAPFLLSQLFAPAMKARSWGRIVNISSRAARMSSGAAGVHYVASKSGMLGLTKIVAQELAPFGITVNSVAPGRIEGEMERAATPEVRTASLAKIPVGRLGTPDEIGELVAFLASDKAGFITGATIDANGGAIMV